MAIRLVTSVVLREIVELENVHQNSTFSALLL